jgi:hypothetical protein
MLFQNNTKKLLKFVAFNSLLLVMATSCSKAPSGVRAKVKDQANVIAPTQTSQATQQAAAQSANYTIATISEPEIGNDYAVNVELQIPNTGEYLPITTRHSFNSQFSQGTYNDTKNNVQVLIQASCSTDNCSKYILLVTVYRNSQALFQTFAISYANDCKFNVVASSGVIGSFYSSLNVAENAHMNVGPRNDLNQCQ